MSAIRAACATIQAVCNQRAMTPPNPTKPETRYHTEEPYILQIAPLIFYIHAAVLWLCALGETIAYVDTIHPLPYLEAIGDIPGSPFTFDSSSTSSIVTTPLFFIGVIATLLGTYIRLDCFAALGALFTFDLTIHPSHKLITKRFYGYVRHPAYTGSMLLVAGATFSHLSRGAWLTECGLLRATGSGVFVWVAWWIWTISVGSSRAAAEDKEMRKLFGKEWESYAQRVHWWFFPGVY